MTVGYTFYLRSEGKLFVAKNGSFLEKEFLSKELSGRKIELDEVVEPLLQPESDATQKDVFLWRLCLMNRKLMIVIMKLRIKLLSNLVGRQGYVLLLSGTVILSYISCC